MSFRTQFSEDKYYELLEEFPREAPKRLAPFDPLLLTEDPNDTEDNDNDEEDFEDFEEDDDEDEEEWEEQEPEFGNGLSS